MIFTQIEDVGELDNGTVIEGIKGTVASVGKRREGEGEYGPYSFQDIVLTDGTEKVTVSCGNKENLIDYKGKFVCLLSGKDKKDKTNGLMAHDKEYNGKVSRIIKANGLMEITETVPASKLQKQQAERSQPQPSAALTGETAAQKLLRERAEAKDRGENPPTTLQTQREQPNAQGNYSTKHVLGKYAHLMYLCRKSAFELAEQCVKVNPLNACSEDALNSMTITMFLAFKVQYGVMGAIDLAPVSVDSKPKETPKPTPKPEVKPPPPPPAPEPEPEPPIEEDDIPF
jgi:hypothetical protein